MGAARRLYVYTVAGISLLVLAIGVENLVALILGEIEAAFGSGLIGGQSTGRERVSLAIALVAVGTPIYGIHWWLANRGLERADAAADADRRSAIRAVYVALVATGGLLVAAMAASGLVERVIGAVIGAPDLAGDRQVSGEVAQLLVGGVIWGAHWRRGEIDLRRDPLALTAGSLHRLHRYVWAFIGLILAVVGSSEVIETVLRALIGRSGFGDGDRSWLGSLAASLSMILIGLAILWLHLDAARRSIRDHDPIGTDDRTSTLRAAYVSVVLLVSIAVVAFLAASAFAELLRLILGVSEATDIPSALELVAGPIAVALPFAVAGWLHHHLRRQEAAGVSPEILAAADRARSHVAAGVGLTFLAAGAAQLLGRLVEVVVGTPAQGAFVPFELAWFVSQATVGAVLWAIAWSTVLRHRILEPSHERTALFGRAYLYLAVGASLVAAVPSAAYSLYRVVDTLLGGTTVALASDLSIPVAIVIVASITAAYHVRILLADLRHGARPEPDVALARPPIAPADRPSSLRLTLRGPAGTDLGSLAQALRLRLPPGVVLEED